MKRGSLEIEEATYHDNEPKAKTFHVTMEVDKWIVIDETFDCSSYKRNINKVLEEFKLELKNRQKKDNYISDFWLAREVMSVSRETYDIYDCKKLEINTHEKKQANKEKEKKLTHEKMVVKLVENINEKEFQRGKAQRAKEEKLQLEEIAERKKYFIAHKEEIIEQNKRCLLDNLSKSQQSKNAGEDKEEVDALLALSNLAVAGAKAIKAYEKLITEKQKKEIFQDKKDEHSRSQKLYGCNG